MKFPRRKICFCSLETLLTMLFRWLINFITSIPPFSFFSVISFTERGFYLIFLRIVKSKHGLFDRRLEIYRRVPTAEDSVEFVSKE